MTVRHKKRGLKIKRKTHRSKKQQLREKPKMIETKLSILEQSGLIGCLTGTEVTSMNYKDFLYKA